MKHLKKHARIYNYLVSATSIRSYRPMSEYTKAELIRLYIEQVNKYLDTLKGLEL